MEDIKHIKKCSTCQVEKEFVEFNSHPATKDGKQSQCKSCAKEYRASNKDKIRAIQNAYNKKNKEKLNTYNKEYYKKNKKQLLEHQKEYNKNNREKSREYQKEWRKKNQEYNAKYYAENKDKLSNYFKEWYDKHKEYHLDYQNERYNSDPNFKLSRCISNFCFKVTNAVKEDKKLRSLEYLGCSIEEFKAHIESQWQEGMTWENHSKDGWHIDHIKPIDWFIKNSDDPWQANHYTNLQPLWAKENLSKSNKF